MHASSYVKFLHSINKFNYYNNTMQKSNSKVTVLMSESFIQPIRSNG